ncbi:MAG: cell division protein SepF [archaeon]
MKKFFNSIKNKVKSWGFDDDASEDIEEEYLELDGEKKSKSSKVIVRQFVMLDFTDIKQVLDALREGNTICLLNIKPLKEKDMVELKRAINKLKKTIEATGGDIAGVGDDYLVVTPAFAEVYRSKEPAAKEDLND